MRVPSGRLAIWCRLVVSGIAIMLVAAMPSAALAPGRAVDAGAILAFSTF